MDIQKETKLVGTVKWFNNVKGYGFIRHASGKDVFVHYSVIEESGFKTLNEGEEVIYELDERVRGLFAKRVARPDAASSVENLIAANSAADASNKSNTPLEN